MVTNDIYDEPNILNLEFTKAIASELREVYENSPSTGTDDNKKHKDAVWLRVAEHAVARLMPTAVNSELPNDAKFVGKKPLSEGVKDMVGNPVDKSVQPGQKSGKGL